MTLIKFFWKLAKHKRKILFSLLFSSTVFVISNGLSGVADNIKADKSFQIPVPVIEDELWQVLETSNGTFKMFNAYYDTRRAPAVRILAFINRVDPIVKTYCRLWFGDGEDPYTSPVVKYDVIWYEGWEVNRIGSQPHIVTCLNPRIGKVPTRVTLIENSTDVPANNFQIIYNLPSDNQKKGFGICAKDLDFMDDQSIQVVEWVETLTLLGAEKIFVYVIKIHENMMRTLKYFEKRGIVKVEKMTEPKGLPSKAECLTQWLQNELISINDCFYKHMYEFQFLNALDIDEIVMPVRDEDRTWHKLMERVIELGHKDQKDLFAGYVANNVFFLSDNIHEGEIQSEVPEFMPFLQNIYRAANFSETGVGVKSFQSTDKVLAMHNHTPLKCLDGDQYCDILYMKKEDAQLNHYRRDCENYPPEQCEDFKKNTVRDILLWRYKDELVKNVERSLAEIEQFQFP